MKNNVKQQLLAHAWIANGYVDNLSQSKSLLAWVELNAEGIEQLREKGRGWLIKQMSDSLQNAKIKLAIPQHWRFTDCLPDDPKASFDHILAKPERDPIWFSQEKISAEWCILKGKVPLDLEYFEGHFATFPLVPGVIELQWVIERFPLFFAQEKVIVRIDNLKFQKFVRPNDEFELTLKWDSVKQQMTFQFKSQNEMCSSGRIVFQNEK